MGSFQVLKQLQEACQPFMRHRNLSVTGELVIFCFHLYRLFMVL